MKTTKILWAAIPAMFLFAAAVVFWGPGPKPKPIVKLREIAVKANPADPVDIERARRKIEEVYEELQKEGDFEQIARSKSEADNGTNGGDMGWMGKGILPKHLEDVAFQLEPGHYSEVIENRVKDRVVFRIILVEERRNF